MKNKTISGHVISVPFPLISTVSSKCITYSAVGCIDVTQKWQALANTEINLRAQKIEKIID
jgi:hypothetical protein